MKKRSSQQICLPKNVICLVHPEGARFLLRLIRSSRLPNCLNSLLVPRWHRALQCCFWCRNWSNLLLSLAQPVCRFPELDPSFWVLKQRIGQRQRGSQSLKLVLCMSFSSYVCYVFFLCGIVIGRVSPNYSTKLSKLLQQNKRTVKIFCQERDFAVNTTLCCSIRPKNHWFVACNSQRWFRNL